MKFIFSAALAVVFALQLVLPVLTVKAGDTLWEIAEGVYGNGADWTKILEANKGSIGFLANGQQALIMTGQVLTLP